MSISVYNVIPAQNSSAAPIGAPEGMLVKDVNDVMRTMMANMRESYNDSEWVTIGDGTPTGVASFISTNTFRISGAATGISYYKAGRAVRVLQNSQYVVGTIVSATAVSGGFEVVCENLTAPLALAIAQVSLEAASGNIKGNLPLTTPIIDQVNEVVLYRPLQNNATFSIPASDIRKFVGFGFNPNGSDQPTPSEGTDFFFNIELPQAINGACLRVAFPNDDLFNIGVVRIRGNFFGGNILGNYSPDITSKTRILKFFGVTAPVAQGSRQVFPESPFWVLESVRD
jgi:hypothetical protein